MPEQKIIDPRREAERKIEEEGALRKIRRRLLGNAQKRENELKPVTAKEAQNRGY